MHRLNLKTTVMWQKTFSTETNEVSTLQLWSAITDINNWKDWDKDLEWIELKGEVKPGASFYLKPKGGPKTKLTIMTIDKPGIFADVAHLPMAKMHTIHTFTQTDHGVSIRVDVKISGLLTFLWSKVIGQKQIEGCPDQTRQLIAKAKTI